MRAVSLAVILVISGYSADVLHARAWLRHRTSDGEFRCAHVLWMRESHWNPRAHNPTTGAHGIPQALPGSKMGLAERPKWGKRWDDWQHDASVQVSWGYAYTKGRYGGFCQALRFHEAHGWY